MLCLAGSATTGSLTWLHGHSRCQSGLRTLLKAGLHSSSWTKSLCFLLAVVWRPPSVLCYRNVYNKAACFMKAIETCTQQRKSIRASDSKTEVTVFCNLLTEGMFCHLCCILLVPSKSLGPTHT